MALNALEDSFLPQSEKNVGMKGLTVTRWCWSTLVSVSTGMGDYLQAGRPSQYVTSHPSQLSLAIPLWLGTMTTNVSWELSRHSARCATVYR